MSTSFKNKKSFFLAASDSEWAGYKNLREWEKYQEYRDSLESMWKIFKPYADDHFQQEMQKSKEQFNQRYWEMYLGCQLLNAKHQLDPKMKNAGPDICLLDKSKKIYIEAICPTSGETHNLNSVPEIPWKQVTEPISGRTISQATWSNLTMDRQIKLRYLSAIEDKYKIICIYLKKQIINNKDSTIIAINSANISSESDDTEIPTMIKLCYGLGDEFIIINKNKANIHDTGYTQECEINKITSINPEEEIKIPSVIFLTNRYPEISAIIFSFFSLSLSNPNKGLIYLAHNPFAKNPLHKGILKLPIKEFWLENIEKDVNGNIINGDIKSKINPNQ